jgi:hypothetical protein
MCVICRNEIDYKENVVVINNCDKIYTLPEDIGNFKRLYCIDLPNLKGIPSSFEKLTTLDIFNCNNIKEICNFKNLTTLVLVKSKSIEKIENIPKLTSLDISDTKNIIDIPFFPELEYLNISRSNFNGDLRKYKNLTMLSAINTKINYIPDNVSYLNCRNCNNLVSIPDNNYELLSKEGAYWLNLDVKKRNLILKTIKKCKNRFHKKM